MSLLSFCLDRVSVSVSLYLATFFIRRRVTSSDSYIGSSIDAKNREECADAEEERETIFSAAPVQ